jgi:hypothetical protein
LVPRGLIPGGLESPPDILDLQRVQPVPAARYTSREIKADPGALSEAGCSVANPLPSDIDWESHEELVLHHLERSGVSMSHQVSNQSAVVPDGLRPLAVGDACGLDDCRIITHVIDQRHESVGKNRMANSDLPVGFGHGRTSHGGGAVGHATGTDVSKIKAANEVVKHRGKT